MPKQTAVEWLEQEFIKLESTIGVYGIMYKLIDQAKAMEKEQIVDAVDGFPLDKRHLDGEQYYNKTYKGGQDGC
jgi:hypothetical protein